MRGQVSVTVFTNGGGGVGRERRERVSVNRDQRTALCEAQGNLATHEENHREKQQTTVSETRKRKKTRSGRREKSIRREIKSVLCPHGHSL